jgi:hypothetical protein
VEFFRNRSPCAAIIAALVGITSVIGCDEVLGIRVWEGPDSSTAGTNADGSARDQTSIDANSTEAADSDYDASNGDADTGSTSDASTCAACDASDDSPPVTSGDASLDAANRCRERDVSDCIPEALNCVPAFVPPRTSPGACTAAEVTTFYNDCLNALATPICDGSDIRSTCFSCLLSQPADPTWGPLLKYAAEWELNFGGCFALEGASPACAASTQEQMQCENASCGTACLASCTAPADSTICASYVSAATNCATTVIQSTCSGGPPSSASFGDAFHAMAKVFCE